MWILALVLAIHCVPRSLAIADSNQANCGHNYQSNCLIVATFGNSQLNESIDALVNCTGDAALKFNQFSTIDSVVWNGCQALRNLRFFGLRKLTSCKSVRSLKIENFFIDSIEADTFEGFGQLGELSIESNSIESISAFSLRGLDSLQSLRMVDNGLRTLGLESLQPLPKLTALQITDKRLLMANHQFGTNQIVGSVALEIYYVEMDLVEHLFNHVRDLSISQSDEAVRACEQSRFNGYERPWLIESLRLANFRCGFMMEDVSTLVSLRLERMLVAPYDSEDEFKLRNLRNLRTLHLNRNDIEELSSVFGGDFSALETLDVSFNQLNAVDVSLFDAFPALVSVNVSHNPIVELKNGERLGLEIAVDSLALDCSGLAKIAQHDDAFRRLNFTRQFESLNINGLECSLPPAPSSIPSEAVALRWHSPELRTAEKFVVTRWNLAVFACGSVLLGAAATYLALYAYTRSRLLRHQPFYHMLRESLVRPFTSARDTLARDFKGIIFRNLPATNYEHPISAATEMTEVIEEGNIYEEIPERMSG